MWAVLRSILRTNFIEERSGFRTRHFYVAHMSRHGLRIFERAPDVRHRPRISPGGAVMDHPPLLSLSGWPLFDDDALVDAMRARLILITDRLSQRRRV